MLLQQAWQKSKYKHRAINILTLVERMNNLTLWVATTILSQRVRLILILLILDSETQKVIHCNIILVDRKINVATPDFMM